VTLQRAWVDIGASCLLSSSPRSVGLIDGLYALPQLGDEILITEEGARSGRTCSEAAATTVAVSRLLRGVNTSMVVRSQRGRVTVVDSLLLVR
jgi:hypothetical protein